jgi:hypothetical protein
MKTDDVSAVPTPPEFQKLSCITLTVPLLGK